MQENIRSLTDKELVEIAMEVQSHTGLPFLDYVTFNILFAFKETLLLKEELIEYTKNSIINECIKTTHEFYRRNPNIKKCYDF